MAGRVAQTIAKVVQEVKLQFPDLDRRYGRRSERTFALYLISPSFREMLLREQMELANDLRFRLEAKTNLNWLVLLYSPEDGQAIKQQIKSEWDKLISDLRHHSQTVANLAKRLKEAEGRGQGIVDLLVLQWRAVTVRLQTDAENFHKIALYHRGRDDQRAKAVEIASEVLAKAAEKLDLVYQDILKRTTEATNWQALADLLRQIYMNVPNCMQKLAKVLDKLAHALAEPKLYGRLYKVQRELNGLLKRTWL